MFAEGRGFDFTKQRQLFPYQGIIEAIFLPVLAFVDVRLSESLSWRQQN
jgi:hypothetical protein